MVGDRRAGHLRVHCHISRMSLQVTVATICSEVISLNQACSGKTYCRPLDLFPGHFRRSIFQEVSRVCFDPRLWWQSCQVQHADLDPLLHLVRSYPSQVISMLNSSSLQPHLTPYMCSDIKVLRIRLNEHVIRMSLRSKACPALRPIKRRVCQNLPRPASRSGWK